jgi:hypothetical protein
MRSLARALGRRFGSLGSRLGDTGWNRGSQGSGRWLAIGLLVGAVKVMARMGTRKREVLLRRELGPGEAIRIAHLLEDRAGRLVRR